MRRSDLDYELPPELIAQTPLALRDESRLMVYERATGAVRHRRFADLPDELAAGDLVVLNDSRVVPARLLLERLSGGAVEVLLLEELSAGEWEALARPSRRLRPGERLRSRTDRDTSGSAGGQQLELVESLGQGRWRVHVPAGLVGELPLPPYIHEPLAEVERYQTVFARELGSAAAPTAGLHLTSDLLEALDHAFVTLHVGVDTFRPVTVHDLTEHQMHGERYRVEVGTWKRIRAAERVVAVGTTCARTLEAVAATEAAGGAPLLAARTELMILPGHSFRAVDALVTNFHLPGSTLLALVMAFAGVSEVRDLYRSAIAERYRFYSFGDAMLIL